MSLTISLIVALSLAELSVGENCGIKEPGELLTFKLQFCKCKRSIKVNGNHGQDIRYGETACSKDAYNRGPNQKVFGFSFYGDPESEEHLRKQFFEGIARNLKTIREKYPQWVMRLYFPRSLKRNVQKDLCEIACENNNLDLCKMEELPGITRLENGVNTTDWSNSDIKQRIIDLPMVWRFLPVIDTQVSLFMSRDLDSKIIDREVSAVQEWLHQDELPFHFLRDHPLHHHSIMGGMWGVKTSQAIREKMVQSLSDALSNDNLVDRGSHYGIDQYFLASHVYPWGGKQALVHASYFCGEFQEGSGKTKAFPTRRKMERNNFVGSLYSYMANEPILRDECPESCRPKEHPEWTQC